MALERPVIGAVNPLPTFTEDRGTLRFDPTTKSTLQDPSLFIKEDTCGNDTYLVYGQSLTVNENIDCTPTLAGSMSLNGFVPVFNTRAADGTISGPITEAELSAALDEHFALLKNEILQLAPAVIALAAV